MEGWGVFHFIVNEIYRVEGCYMVMDADGLFDISDYTRMDEKKVSDIWNITMFDDCFCTVTPCTTTGVGSDDWATLTRF